MSGIPVHGCHTEICINRFFMVETRIASLVTLSSEVRRPQTVNADTERFLFWSSVPQGREEKSCADNPHGTWVDARRFEIDDRDGGPPVGLDAIGRDWFLVSFCQNTK